MHPTLTSTSVTRPAPIPPADGAARRAAGRHGATTPMLDAPKPEVGLRPSRQGEGPSTDRADGGRVASEGAGSDGPMDAPDPGTATRRSATPARPGMYAPYAVITGPEPARARTA